MEDRPIGTERSAKDVKAMCRAIAIFRVCPSGSLTGIGGRMLQGLLSQCIQLVREWGYVRLSPS